MSMFGNSRKYLESTAFLALAIGAVSPLSAQAQDEEGATSAASEDVIVVTGSSIRGAPAVGSNLISVGRDMIEETAAQSVQDLLKSVPAVWGANAASQGGFGANDTAGAAVPQIHGIGGANSSSTLVVVDGHRFPLTGIIRNLADPNFIPPNAIERVEVLAEGASSIYGSDAVAGALNFITRRKFQGMEAGAQYGFGDSYRNWSATLSLGTRWQTGGAAVFYSYSDKDRLAVVDRPLAMADQRARGGRNFSNFNCSPATIQPAGQALLYQFPYSGTGFANDLANAAPSTLCDQSNYSDLVPAERRHSVMMKLDQEVGDRLTLSSDIVYSVRNSNTNNAVAVAHGQGVPSAVQQLITATAFGPGYANAAQINPFYENPTGITADRQTIRWDGNDLFPNGAKQYSLSEVFYAHARAEYDLSDKWQVAAFAVAGMSNARTTITDRLCQSCVMQALNGTFNSNGTGEVTALTAANALDIWRPLATNRTSPDVLKRLLDARTYQASRQTTQQFNLSTNGTLFALPAGDVRVAVGGDIVKYSQDAEVVDTAGRGPSSTASTFTAVSYQRTVKSVYGELLVPVISEEMGVPGIRSLVVNVSGRYDHYNEFGSITNPKFALNWEVVQGLKLRANYATSFVAPQFSTYGPDTLSGRDGLSVDSYFAPVSSQINIPLDLYPEARGIPGCDGAAQVTCLLGTGGINGMRIEGANPNVTPSKGKTWAVGADFAPNFLPGFRASVTFWHTTLTESVGAPPIGIVVNSPTFKHLLTIYPNGATAAEIETFRNGLRQISPLNNGPVYFSNDARNQNIYNVAFEGFDFDLKYRHQFDGGAIRLGVNGTLKTRMDQYAAPGEPTFSVLGKHRFNGTFPANRFDGRGELGLELGDFSGVLMANYTGGYTFWGNSALNPVISKNGIPTSGGDKVKSYTTVDLSLTYDWKNVFAGKIQTFVNVDNVFNAYPPFENNTNAQANGSGYDNLLAFPMGRVVTIGARIKL